MPEDNFGYIYDWMEDYTLPEDYTESNKEDLLRNLYDEMMVMIEHPVDYSTWKRDYGRYFEVYNPAQEELLEEKFDIKYDQTEKLFDLKTNQEERDYALIEKYSAIDDSDDFESSTEMSIRHADEQKVIDQKMARYKLTSEGLNLNQKKKIASDKSLLKNLRSGESDAIVDELDKTFWDNMKVVRSEYDKQRLDKNQALDSLILKSDQIVESAFKSKTDTIDTLFQSAETTMKNAAVDLLGDKIDMREEYDEELWDTMGELAAGETFIGCGGGCPDNEVCVAATGECTSKAAVADSCFEQGGSYTLAGGVCMLPTDADDCSDCDSVCHRMDTEGDGQVVCGWELRPEDFDPEAEGSCYTDADCGNHNYRCNDQGQCEAKACMMLPGGCEGEEEGTPENYYCVTEGMDSPNCPESDDYIGDCALLGDCPDAQQTCQDGGGTWEYVPPHSGFGLGSGSYQCIGVDEPECPCTQCDDDNNGTDCNGNSCTCYPNPFN